MTYQPSVRCLKGMQSMARRSMSKICDVCGGVRGVGSHDRCSKIRQAAGFIIDGRKEE